MSRGGLALGLDDAHRYRDVTHDNLSLLPENVIY